MRSPWKLVTGMLTETMSNVVLLKYAFMLLMLSIYYILYLIMGILTHISDIMSMFLPMPHVDSQLLCWWISPLSLWMQAYSNGTVQYSILNPYISYKYNRITKWVMMVVSRMKTGNCNISLVKKNKTKHIWSLTWLLCFSLLQMNRSRCRKELLQSGLIRTWPR